MDDEPRWYKTGWRWFEYDTADGGAATYGSLTGRWVSGSRGSTVANGAGLAWHQRGILGPIGDFSRGVANTVIPFGIVDRVHQSRGEPTPDSDAYRAGEGSGVVLGMVLPLPGGKIKGLSLLNVSVRGTKDYAHDLFRKHAGDEALKVIRDRGTGRIVGVRTESGNVILRPKGGRGGVTANVEVINSNGVRVNVHIRP